MNGLISTSNFPVPADQLLRSASEILRQAETLLEVLEDELYVTRVAAAFDATIGGHVRHCLDHFRSLWEALGVGAVNYDHRARGTLVETDRFAALNEVRALVADYDQLAEAVVEEGLLVICKTSYDGQGSPSASSTVGRELMYCVAHAVHHYALIGVMGRLLGVALPNGFGVAPSTLQHQCDKRKEAEEGNASHTTGSRNCLPNGRWG